MDMDCPPPTTMLAASRHFLPTLASVRATVAFLICFSWPAHATDIQRLLALPEEQLDIGSIALEFAKDVYPLLDTAAYSRRLDELSTKVRLQARGTKDMERRIAALNSVLFRHEGFHYDHGQDARSALSNYFLNGILDSRRGTCYTMPLLYVAIAQRAGYPVYLVAAPDHLFARYVDGRLGERNIEVTSGGKYIPDSDYIRDFSIGSAGLLSGSYLQTLSYRKSLGHMFGANALYYAANGKASRAVQNLRWAAMTNPAFADNHQNLAELYSALADHSRGERAIKYRESAQAEANTAKALGFIGIEDVAIGMEGRRR